MYTTQMKHAMMLKAWGKQGHLYYKYAKHEACDQGNPKQS